MLKAKRCNRFHAVAGLCDFEKRVCLYSATGGPLAEAARKQLLSVFARAFVRPKFTGLSAQ